MIDNITYNDLNLDNIYDKINTCRSSSGDDYLKNSIINPFNDSRNDFCNLIDYFSNNLKIDFIGELKKRLSYISKLKKYSFDMCMDGLLKSEIGNNLIHYISGIVVVICFLLIFVWPGPGLLATFVAIAFSLSLYFKEQKDNAKRLYAYQYILRMLSQSSKIVSYYTGNNHNSNLSDELEKKSNERINEIVLELKLIKSDLKQISRGAFLIKTNVSTDGNPFDVLLDYARMIFHVDLIKYNNVLTIIKNKEKSIRRLYEILGMFDAAIAVAEYKNSLEYTAKPEFVTDNRIEIVEAYHPLIENPVYNSISTDGNILLTGSNASGKSTFLKTIALCIIYAESFGFSLCKSIKVRKANVYTSMALRDDITNGESYFIKEIKSLKRIVEAKEKGEDCICFIDEVLKGTNTVERIAASSEILKGLSANNILVFAATHDIELTDLLMDSYTNYHFTESIENERIVFSYKLLPGRSESSNAIKLLGLMGYDKNTISNAEIRANAFLKTGKWE